jgi:hypothetical protein
VTRAVLAGQPDDLEAALVLVLADPGGPTTVLALLALLQTAGHLAADLVAAAAAETAATTEPAAGTLLRLGAEGHHEELIARCAGAVLAGDTVDVDASLGAFEPALAPSIGLGLATGLDILTRWRGAT